ncbi:Gfo/Idh/MocA family protein [Brachybacterium sp. FME24]|uniref:Gfo/Idh/MocA family protein n=1 Tax=Brachybacterium sp. FME24 TaxID=2742605 RepID=UPI001866CAE6|nr:Gfo/Idh/MocA family oxidoreductase [Brachybacterium sp. FME24]
MNTVIGVGLIGLGTIGRSHARALDALRDRTDLRAFSGGGTAAAAEAGWPGAAQVPPEELMVRADVDVIAICSPSGVHAEQALAALEAGKHVVVEKPLALTAPDADRIVSLAAERGLTVSTISQRRLEPEVVAVRRALEAGTLGAVRLATTHVHWWRGDDYYAAVAWRGDPAGGGGSLMNQGVHNVDLLQWLAGPVESVTAQQATLAHDTEAEDMTVATLRFAGGALGLISTTTATPPGSPATLTLHCERGVVEIGQGEITRWDVDGVPTPQFGTDREGIGVGSSDHTAIGLTGHIQQWRDILAAIAEGRDPAITAADGAATVRLIDAITTAARTGSLVTLKELR